jgi:cystathionine gamma-synthase
LDRLEAQLKAQQSTSERILAVFCEFPGNPLLRSPDLQRLRALADTYDFAVIVDETIGCFANIQLLPWADAIVSSLTKVFSGDSNVMGGR